LGAVGGSVVGPRDVGAFFIGRGARHPHVVLHYCLPGFVQLAIEHGYIQHFFLELVRHVDFGALLRFLVNQFFVCVRYRLPIIDLVHLEEDARFACSVSVALGLRAFVQRGNGEMAGLACFGPFGVVAHVTGFGYVVRFEEGVDSSNPFGHFLRVGLVEGQREDVRVGESRSIAHTGVVADETIRLRPFGSVIFQRGEEDEHQHGEETGQEGIEDDVEHQNLKPTLGRTSEDFFGVLIVEELRETGLGWRALNLVIVVLLVTHFGSRSCGGTFSEISPRTIIFVGRNLAAGWRRCAAEDVATATFSVAAQPGRNRSTRD